MNTIIKLLRAQCLPYLNQHYQLLLEQSDRLRMVGKDNSFAQNLREVWGFSHALQKAKNVHDLIMWLEMINQPYVSDIEKEVKQRCRARAQQCFEQMLSKDLPDEQEFEQIKRLLY